MATSNILSFDDCFELLREFLFYMHTIKGRSSKTVDAYYIDLRTFFRYIKLFKVYKSASTEDFDSIKIDDIKIELIRQITLSDIYEFLNYSFRERSNSASTRSRKISAIRSFFKFLTFSKNLIEDNPTKNLETPKIKKSVPKYLTLENALELLNSVGPEFYERDYCILVLFLNCGMRLSELVGLNTYDIRENTLKLLGKGNKERVIYLNDACLRAIEDYLKVRNAQRGIKDKTALFLTRNGTRIGARQVELIVKKCLENAGLDNMGYSPHKLRHTAATLMYQHGGVDIRILKDILGHVNLGTTEIYTHISSTQMENAMSSSPLSKVKHTKKLKDMAE